MRRRSKTKRRERITTAAKPEFMAQKEVLCKRSYIRKRIRC